jgi:hypothetical protein
VVDTSSSIILLLRAWAGVRISVREEKLTSCCKSESVHQHSLITLSQGWVDDSKATSKWVEPEERVLSLGCYQSTHKESLAIYI